VSTVIKTLASKPWLTGSSLDDAPADTHAFNLPQEKVGLRVFFGVATSLFLLFIVGYRMRMVYEDWVPLQEPGLLWINTGLLVLASIALQIAKSSAAADKQELARKAFYSGGVCTFLFIAGQLAVWQQLSYTGHFVSSNPASSFFYLLTAVHGLHILGGLVAWARVLGKLHPGGDFTAARMGIDLCTVYWHYLLVVWGVLFYLLLST
jgi:cytochrome c oxidase subunit 3